MAIFENFISVGLRMILNSVEDKTEKSMVLRWIKEWENYYKRKARLKKVLEAIGEGYDTVSEIAAYTGIPSATVWRILSKFVRIKQVRAIAKQNLNSQREFRYEII